MTPKRTFSKEQLNIIVEFYQTHSIKETASKFSVDYRVLKRIFSENNIPLRTREESIDMVIKNSRATNLIKYGVENPFGAQEVKDKIKDTLHERYGVDHYSKTSDFSQKVRSTKKERYGSCGFNNPDKRRETCLERYGTPSASGNADIRKKIEQTCIERYGVNNVSKSSDVIQKIVQHQTERYGGVGFSSPELSQKYVDTCMERYGIPYYCMSEDCNVHGSRSKVNEAFASRLEAEGIQFEREFPINRYAYDFKVGNNLIELNPTATHNSTFGLFKDKPPKSKTYHYDKSITATKNGYRCICVWDWDDIEKVISLLQKRERIYARQCEVRTVCHKEAYEFINKYHIQGYARSSIRLGLFYKDELVSIMTFGKPRYNKKFDYELIRYCSSKLVVGGCEKLFAY